MKGLLAKISAKIDTFVTDSELHLEKGNKSAGIRARKASLELSKLFKDYRKASVEESKK
ncbi:histone H1-like protein Hc1 [Flavobacterium sp. 9]|uniref:histone H1 n=1 Tax=Flavobacterium sp. 9 TaxID=2035198 RepID=UPI000C19C403|nr:histone H1 [Flavobacterium sp. 9]PIF30170.1 histone H1-like protein Hc1 [Flavobacterium sp. 9]